MYRPDRFSIDCERLANLQPDFGADGDGRSYMNGNETLARAGFRGAPDGVSSMAVGTNISPMFEGAAGFELKLRDHLSFGAEYGRASADHYNMDRFNFVLRIPFGK